MVAGVLSQSAALADMKRPGVVLLLLTSAAAVQYHWQDAVSLPGPAVQTTSAVSEPACAILCKNLPSVECSGFIYGTDDDTCRLFSGDCRGPAADSSQQTTDRYLGRSNCPGENKAAFGLSFIDRCGKRTKHPLRRSVPAQKDKLQFVRVSSR